MRYFTWTEPAEPAWDPRNPHGTHAEPAGPSAPGTGAPRPGAAPGAPRERVLDEICCLEMT
jgi:hypothetical protein